jgi:hypothetical protein
MEATTRNYEQGIREVDDIIAAEVEAVSFFLISCLP